MYGVVLTERFQAKPCHVITMDFNRCALLQQYHEDGARIEAAFRRYIHRADPKQKEDSYEIIVCHANVIRYFVCRCVLQRPNPKLFTLLTVVLRNTASVYLIAYKLHLCPFVLYAISIETFQGYLIFCSCCNQPWQPFVLCAFFYITCGLSTYENEFSHSSVMNGTHAAFCFNDTFNPGFQISLNLQAQE